MTSSMSKCRFNIGDLVRMKDRVRSPRGICVVVYVACEDNRRAYRVRASSGNHWLCHEDMLELASKSEWDREEV